MQRSACLWLHSYHCGRAYDALELNYLQILQVLRWSQVWHCLLHTNTFKCIQGLAATMTASQALVHIEALMQINDSHIKMTEIMPVLIAFTVDKHGKTIILGTVDISDMYSITRATAEAKRAKVRHPIRNICTFVDSISHTTRLTNDV